MGSELAEKQSFQQKMMDRIRDSIGELLTDEELKAIIERGVEEALFKERKREHSWRDTVTYEPSLVQATVETHLKVQMQEQVAKWIDDNPKLLTDAVKDACAKGAGACLARYLDARFENMFAVALRDAQDAAKEL